MFGGARYSPTVGQTDKPLQCDPWAPRQRTIGPTPTTTIIEILLLTTARVSTFFGAQPMTGTSGFYFQRDERLYLVTNRHVLIDRPAGHLPDRIEIEVHTDAHNLTHAAVLSVLLYRDGRAIWYRGRDSAGDIDVAAIELDRGSIAARRDAAGLHAHPAAQHHARAAWRHAVVPAPASRRSCAPLDRLFKGLQSRQTPEQ